MKKKRNSMHGHGSLLRERMCLSTPVDVPVTAERSEEAARVLSEIMAVWWSRRAVAGDTDAADQG
jgi:hypothetical protein